MDTQIKEYNTNIAGRVLLLLLKFIILKRTLYLFFALDYLQYCYLCNTEISIYVYLLSYIMIKRFVISFIPMLFKWQP
jgi:hypothetical protein